MSLRESIEAKRPAPFASSSAFLYTYLGALTLINVYGALAVSPRDTIHFQFYYFWHSHGESTGLLTWITAVNSLAVIYLWLEFRKYRRTARRKRKGLYLYFVGGALVLMLFQLFYLQVSRADLSQRALVYDLRTPVAVPGR